MRIGHPVISVVPSDGPFLAKGQRLGGRRRGATIAESSIRACLGALVGMGDLPDYRGWGMRWLNAICCWVAFGCVALTLGCTTQPKRTASFKGPPGEPVIRHNDEIIVCGERFRIGTPVVLWTDPGGYDAYRVERRFAPWAESDWKSSAAAVPALTTPNRYGFRQLDLTDATLEQVRGGGWTLRQLQERVDQFVLHYDASGTSRQCFKVLHDLRGLSVHFMLDVDGTIYQTLDLKERAWHATTSNSRGIGIEIAQIGAVPVSQQRRLEPWYISDSFGVRLTYPDWMTETGIRTPNFVGRPARDERVIGKVQGQDLVQYDFTPEQYRALIRLTAALCRVFPKLTCDYPRDADGNLIREKLEDTALQEYSGILGHYHVQKDKVDPGPAFQWDTLIQGARREMGLR
jgi:N-acetylmuramoyl-L-alanine amidase